MTIPTSTNFPQFLVYLFMWKTSVKWFLEHYSLTDFDRDLASTVAADPHDNKFHVRNFANLSEMVQKIELKNLYFRNEVKLLHTLLTSKAEYDKFFSTKPLKSSPVRTAAIATITANLPLFYSWPEADGGGEYLVLSPDEVIGLDSYQDNVLNISQIPTSKLAGLASTAYDVAESASIPEEIKWIAAQRGITLPTHTNILGEGDDASSEEDI